MATLIATGNLGKDAELKNANNGSAFLKFSVGDSKSKPDGNGGFETISQQWLECTVWGPQAEALADLRKGDRVTVYGEFYTREYTDKEGATRTSLDVKVHGVNILKRKDGDQGGGGYAQRPAGAPQSAQQGQWGQAPQWGNGQPQQAAWPQQGQQPPY